MNQSSSSHVSDIDLDAEFELENKNDELIVLYYFIGLIFIVSKDVIQIAIGSQWIKYDWILL